MTQLDLQQKEVDRRITACVNAFDGIPTERIEGKNLGQILAGEMRLHGAGPRNDGGFGFEFSGGVCQLMAEAYAEQFKESGAINYLELLFDHTEIGPLTITMQRVQGLTPAQKLAQAEAERDALQQQVNVLAALRADEEQEAAFNAGVRALIDCLDDCGDVKQGLRLALRAYRAEVLRLNRGRKIDDK